MALPRPIHMVERNLFVYRRTFIVIFSGFFEPLFYLFSMGFGVGSLIGDVPLGDGRSVSYAVFVAPALLASSAMNGAIYETTNNFFYKLKYAKLYDAVIATPISLLDLAQGDVEQGNGGGDDGVVQLGVFELVEEVVGGLVNGAVHGRGSEQRGRHEDAPPETPAVRAARSGGP